MIEARTLPQSIWRGALERVWASRATHAEGWNAIGVFAVRAASAALLFATQVALARWMGAAEYGLFVAAWACVLVLGGLTHLGFNVTAMRLAPQYHANRNYAAFRGLWRGGRMLGAASASVVALLGMAALWIHSAATGTPLSIPLLLAMLCLPFFTFSDVQDGFGRGQGWTFEAIIPPYIVRPLLLLLLVVALHAMGFSEDAATGMAIVLAAIFISALLQTALLERRIASEIPASEPAYDVRKWLAISLPVLAASVFELAIQNADVLLLALLRPSEEAGIYYAAAKTAGLALFIHYAVGTAYAGRIAAAHVLENDGEMRRLVAQAVRWTFVPTATVMLVILAIGYPVLTIFGEGFTDAYPLMFILALGILIKAATGPSETILNMLGHQRACAASLAVAAVAGVALHLILIPIWGVTGAAIATASAVVTASALNWYAARRLEGLNLFVLARATPDTR